MSNARGRFAYLAMHVRVAIQSKSRRPPCPQKGLRCKKHLITAIIGLSAKQTRGVFAKSAELCRSLVPWRSVRESP